MAEMTCRYCQHPYINIGYKHQHQGWCCSNCRRYSLYPGSSIHWHTARCANYIRHHQDLLARATAPDIPDWI